MVNLIVILVLAAIIGGASFYIYRARKNGAKCIGCPDSKSCSGCCAGCASSCPYRTGRTE